MYEVLGINVEPKSIVGGLYEKALLGFKKRSGVSTGNNRCSPKSKNKSQSIEFYLSSIISCRSNIEQEWSFISLKILLSHILSVNFIELCFRQINFKFKAISKIAVIILAVICRTISAKESQAQGNTTIGHVVIILKCSFIFGTRYESKSLLQFNDIFVVVLL